MGDKALRGTLCDALECIPGIHSAHIAVAVDAGIVTLSGHVGSYTQRCAVEMAVRRVAGVRAIVQHIEVRYPDGMMRADDEIAADALKRIDGDGDIPDDLTVKVEEGTLTLTGTVDRCCQRRRAEAAMRALEGVRLVINYIAVRDRAAAGALREWQSQALVRGRTIETAAVGGPAAGRGVAPARQPNRSPPLLRA